MNDNFHASNVARHRLTACLGWERHTLIKVRQGCSEADLSFSGVKFLSNGLRNNRKPVYNYRDREGSGSARRLSRKPNTRALSSLPDTVHWRCHRQACDMFENESVQECDGKSAQVSVRKNSGPQGHSEGSRDLSQATTIPYTWSEIVRSPRLEDPFETHTKQLLNVNLNAQETSEEALTPQPNKRYWTLEELRCLLEQRRVLWDSQANVPEVSANQIPHTRSRKRKRSPSTEMGIYAQAPEVVEIHYDKNNTEQYTAIGAPTPSHHDLASQSAAQLRQGGDINGESIQTWHGQPAFASSQICEQADISDVCLPTSDFTLYPGTLGFTSPSLPQDVGPMMRYGKGCYDKSLTHHTNETVPLLGESNDLDAQTLSAAYDVIMQPELDPLYDDQGYQLTDTTRTESRRVGNNESVIHESNYYYASGLSNDLSSCRRIEEDGIFSHDSARQKEL
ncbi:hypothetical protein BBP40_002489 [Aspergillus hancockii]|nr:hypothetical protein BBP40_002489 [Aspergillus hancockii]